MRPGRLRLPGRTQVASALAHGLSELARASLCGVAVFVFCTAWHAPSGRAPARATVVPARPGEFAPAA